MSDEEPEIPEDTPPEESPSDDPGTPPDPTPLGAPMSPTPETQLGYSYEYGIDIKVGTAGTEDDWQVFRFLSNVNPNFTPKELDGSTYDDLGADHPVKVGETGQLDFFVQQHRLEDGKFLPEMEAILAAARPDANGNKAVVTLRYYDKPAAGTPNADEAYELTATITVARSTTGNAEIGGWNITAKAQGPRRKIANPAITPAP